MDQRYRYTGPCSAVSLPADATHPKGRHVQLTPACEAVLPDDSIYVKTLLAKKLLTLLGPVETPAGPVASSATQFTAVKPSAATTATTASNAATSTSTAGTSPAATTGE